MGAAEDYVLLTPYPDLRQLARLEAQDRARAQAELTRKHPVDYPRALRAAETLKRRLGFPSKPHWLVDVCGAIDGCGRPYVHVTLNQWLKGGGLRLSTAPDGEVPELPKKVDGIPVFVAVAQCFGGKAPGCKGEPCVERADPASQDAALGTLTHRVRRLKQAIDDRLGDLGELERDSQDACLPSGRAWVALVRDGDLGSLGRAAAHTGLRAALIGVGLWAVGARRETLVRDAVAGSLSVDAFILMWSICQR